MEPGKSTTQLIGSPARPPGSGCRMFRAMRDSGSMIGNVLRCCAVPRARADWLDNVSGRFLVGLAGCVAGRTAPLSRAGNGEIIQNGAKAVAARRVDAGQPT